MPSSSDRTNLCNHDRNCVSNGNNTRAFTKSGSDTNMAPADDDFDIYGEDEGFSTVKVDEASLSTFAFFTLRRMSSA